MVNLSLGKVVITIRVLPRKIPKLDTLGQLQCLEQFIKDKPQGLLIISGKAGAGCSTTVAAFLNEFNERFAIKIVNLEKSTEYIYKQGISLIEYKSEEEDFKNFLQAILNAYRGDADIIYVDNLDSAETIKAAIKATSKCLVVAHIDADGVINTLRNLENSFRLEDRQNIREDLLDVLVGIVSQRLYRLKEGGRTAITEIIFPKDTARNIIQRGDYTKLHYMMSTIKDNGMKLFSDAIKEVDVENN